VLSTLSRGSSVSIVTELRAGQPGFDYQQDQGLFSLPPHPDRLWAYPASYTMVTCFYFSGGKAARAWSWPLNSI